MSNAWQPLRARGHQVKQQPGGTVLPTAFTLHIVLRASRSATLVANATVWQENEAKSKGYRY